jgi:hypothetical protein
MQAAKNNTNEEVIVRKVDSGGDHDITKVQFGKINISLTRTDTASTSHIHYFVARVK